MDNAWNGHAFCDLINFPDRSSQTNRTSSSSLSLSLSIETIIEWIGQKSIRIGSKPAIQLSILTSFPLFLYSTICSLFVSNPLDRPNHHHPFCLPALQTMQQPAPSTRWCPTPEQLMILEEMYRTGIRTPNAAQIRQITAHLSYYGKIEGKNVFYWFQNHKARDRQKMRRRLSCLQQQQNGQVLQAQAQAQAQTLLSHQIFHLELSPHPPSPSALLPHLHFPYHHHLRRHQPSSHFLHQVRNYVRTI